MGKAYKNINNYQIKSIMKSVLIIGNLGHNAETVTMNDGTQKMRFSVAVNGRGDKMTWFGVLARMQEKLLPYLTKGRQVFVQGELSADLYNNQISLNVYADRIELCGGKDSTEVQKEETF